MTEFWNFRRPNHQGLRSPISNNFHFWSVWIRALYQKLWPFKVFPSKNFWNHKSMIQTSIKHSKHTNIRKHTSCTQWEQNQWTEIDPNDIDLKSTKTRECKNGVSEWNHKRQWEPRRRTTREGQHHVPVRTWARKWDKMQESMCERENGNVRER